MDLNLPEGTVVYADSGFLDASFEQALSDPAGIQLVVPRRKNMKDQLDGCLQYICGAVRKRIETTFSQLNERFARSIHAVTPRGFELKCFAPDFLMLSPSRVNPRLCSQLIQIIAAARQTPDRKFLAVLSYRVAMAR